MPHDAPESTQQDLKWQGGHVAAQAIQDVVNTEEDHFAGTQLLSEHGEEGRWNARKPSLSQQDGGAQLQPE